MPSPGMSSKENPGTVKASLAMDGFGGLEFDAELGCAWAMTGHDDAALHALEHGGLVFTGVTVSGCCCISPRLRTIVHQPTSATGRHVVALPCPGHTPVKHCFIVAALLTRREGRSTLLHSESAMMPPPSWQTKSLWVCHARRAHHC